MKWIVFITTVTLLVCIIFNGCRKSSDTISGPPSSTNLIMNSSFENNGNPSLEEWKSYVDDTSAINFSNSLPPDGGNFSVRLLNDWTSMAEIFYKVVPQSGTHAYRLSVWGRTIKPDSFLSASGNLSITLKTGDTQTQRKSLWFQDTVWTMYSLLDTVTTVSTDTIIIDLRAGMGQFSWGYTLFDLCKFEKLD